MPPEPTSSEPASPLPRKGRPRDPAPQRYEFLASGGTEIPVTVQGSGPPIVLVHGGATTGEAWSIIAARLATRFSTYRFDRATYRRVPPSAAGEAVAAEVEDILAVARTAGKPLLVGHSSGAIMCLEAALSQPSAFAGLLVYEPPVAVEKPLGGQALVKARAALDEGKPRKAMRVHLRKLVGMSPFSAALHVFAPPIWKAIEPLVPGQIADDEAIESLGVGLNRYAELDVPTLPLGGAKSPTHLRERLGALAGVLPNVRRTVIMEKEGHAAVNRGPDEVARVVGAFADEVLR